MTTAYLQGGVRTPFGRYNGALAMMRGGHLDLCVLGAFQVSAHGDLANWSTGEPDAIPAVGGAMDLAIGAKQTFAVMSLLDRISVPLRDMSGNRLRTRAPQRLRRAPLL